MKSKTTKNLKGKIIAIFGKDLKLYYEGNKYNAFIRGKILKDFHTFSPAAVGDNVEFSFTDDRQAAINKILPRQQILARPDLLVKDRVKVIATNLDQLVIISSTRSPKFKQGLIDRLLINAEKEELEATIVINKTDLVENLDKFEIYSQTWQSLGYRVIYSSAKSGDGLDKLISCLKNKSSALTGHSGVGKSALLNAIQPSLNLHTREISSATGKGVHSTTSVIMHPLDFGGWVVDTPGMKVFGLTGFDKSNLYKFFPEIAALNDMCRFNDCRHIAEPGCAVKKAVNDGEIAEFRYANYNKLLNQLE